MRTDYYLSKREGLALAMNQLFHYNVWATFSLDESSYQEDILLKYFDAEFGDTIEQDIENVIIAAVTKTVYEKNYIPEKNKKEFAKKCARQHIDALRLAKTIYYEHVYGMSRLRAQSINQENVMVKRMSIVDNTIKWGIRKGTKVGISFTIGWLITLLAPEIVIPMELLGIASYIIISLLPNKIKKPIIEGITIGVDYVWRTAKNLVDDLARATVNVAQKAKVVVAKVGTKIKKVCKDTKEIVGQTWQETKDFAEQAWEDTKILAEQAWEDTKTFARQAWEITDKGVRRVKELLGIS